MRSRSPDIPNKHQQKTEQTRHKLLAAAMRIFAKDGFEAARIEDIAAAAGHTRGAFYANFATKEDVFLALLEQQGTQRLAQLRAGLEKCGNPDEALRCLRQHYITRSCDRRWVMLTLEFKLFALRHGRLRIKLAAAHRRIRASLNFDSLAKLLPTYTCATHPEAKKALLEAAMYGLVLEHSYDPSRISEAQVEQLLGEVFDLAMSGSEDTKMSGSEGIKMSRQR
jgi:AcrR family transcriptional regulator